MSTKPRRWCATPFLGCAALLLVLSAVSASPLDGEGSTAGDRVHAQYWSRDPVASYGAGLTNAVAIDLAP